MVSAWSSAESASRKQAQDDYECVKQAVSRADSLHHRERPIPSAGIFLMRQCAHRRLEQKKKKGLEKLRSSASNHTSLTDHESYEEGTGTGAWYLEHVLVEHDDWEVGKRSMQRWQRDNMEEAGSASTCI